MNPESLGGGAITAVAVVVIGWAGKALLAYWGAKRHSREITTAQRLSSTEHARAEANELLKFAFTKTQEQMDDMEAALDRLAKSERRLQDDVDRLRAEREAAKEDALNERLRARELDQKLGECRRLHENLKHELERQQAELDRLRGQM